MVVQTLSTIYYTRLYCPLIPSCLPTSGRKRTNNDCSGKSLTHFVESILSVKPPLYLNFALSARRIMQRVNSKVQNYDGFIALEWKQDREKKGTKAIRTRFLIIYVLVIERLIAPR
ncbi:hypothetical protein ACS0PU_012994 [Formica fusca]